MQGNVIESLEFRATKFVIHFYISNFEDFLIRSLDKIYKYNGAAVVFNESFDSSNDDRDYGKYFYSLLIAELEFKAKLLINNIFRVFRIVYLDNRDKKLFSKSYYYDLLSTDRVRKDNATTVLEQILPYNLYIEIYNLFVIEDFENKNRDRDFKETALRRYDEFTINDEKLLEFIKKDSDTWLKLIFDYGEKKGDQEMLERMDRVNFLKKTEVFKDVPGEVLFLLATKAQEVVYPKDEYILKTGDLVEFLFIIYKGEVDILVGEEECKSVAILGEKDVLGEVELFREIEKRRAVASVRAKSDEVICIRIRKSDFDEVFENNTELARALIRSLGERLESMNVKIQEVEKKGS